MSSEAQNERGKDTLLSDSVKLGQGLAAGIKARASTACLSSRAFPGRARSLKQLLPIGSTRPLPSGQHENIGRELSDLNKHVF